MEWLSFFINLFALANPFGVLPVFVSLTQNMDSNLRKRVSILTGISVVCICLIFLLFGSYILSFFGITVYDFQISGGIVLILMGLQMIQGADSPVHHDKDPVKPKQSTSIAVVPLSLPLLSGPGVISAVVSNTNPMTISKLFQFSGSIIMLGIVVTVIFYFCHHLHKILTPSIMKVLVRVMGLIIMCIATELLVEGIKGALF
ncbi:MAG: MarC family protein [Pseudomonadota bacterium]|nr:MarC family protein [Pseudomonadota bacterium]